jgi:hypothetical protein
MLKASRTVRSKRKRLARLVAGGTAGRDHGPRRRCASSRAYERVRIRDLLAGGLIDVSAADEITRLERAISHVAEQAACHSQKTRSVRADGNRSGYAATRASRSVSSRISTAIFVRADAYCRL